MPTKIPRRNISIYEPLLRLYKLFLLEKETEPGREFDSTKDIGKSVWGLMKKEMIANGFSATKIKQAERITVWNTD